MILTIDLGTTYFKFAVFDRHGRLCSCATRVPSVTSSPEGTCEIPAAAFLDDLHHGIAAALAQANSAGAVVEAVSFATQGNSFLLLDSRHRPLTPILLWTDQRAHGLEEETRSRLRQAATANACGVPDVTREFMVAKLLWLQRFQPHTWDAAARLCLISDYLTFLLTGSFVGEAGTACLAALADIRAVDWADAARRGFEIPSVWLPPLVRAGCEVGRLQRSAAERLGLPASCRFVIGCLDQYAGALGVGCVKPGMIAETTGTVLAAVTPAERLLESAPDGLIQGPTWDAMLFWRMAFGQVAGNYLHWYREQLPDRPDFATLCEYARNVSPGAAGLTIDRTLPSVAAALARHLDAAPTSHVVRAILEAVALSLRDHVASLCQHPVEVRSAGGGARSEVWLQIKADVLGVPFRRTSCLEPTSLGAAILAEAALCRAAPEQVADAWVDASEVWTPQPAARQAYLELP